MKLLKIVIFSLPFLLLSIFLLSRLNQEKKIQSSFFGFYQGHNKQKIITPKSALKRLFEAENLQSNWFTITFLEDVPLEQLQSIITNLKGEGGRFECLKEIGEKNKEYQVFFEKTIITAKIVLDENNRIARLNFGNPVAKFKNIAQISSQFTSLPGEVSLLVLEENSQLVTVNPNNVLAVGSAFKLAVLKALRERIKLEDKYSWGDIIEIKENIKSLPTGILQDWPDGSILTIESLATFMISQSDNTATDILIHWLGKENIEPLILKDNHPLLTTREFFIIKNNQEILERYRNVNKEQKISILAEIQNYPLPDVEAIEKQPVAIDVEWFFSTQQLCSLIEELHDLPLMQINSGIADKDDWKQIAFKGGSEPGVLNLTTWVQANNGKSYCVSATWNNANESLDESHFFSLYSGVLELLKSRTI